jgi:hypothetical protein
MAHQNKIEVDFGQEVYYFKSGTSPRVVLDELVKLHPPRGCLKHVHDAGLVVSSQEQVLSQERYTYHAGHTNNPEQNQDVNPSSLNAVFRLLETKKKKSEVIGTAVVCSPNGIVLTADHCLKDLPRRAQLTVGGQKAEILARDSERDIAVLQLCQPTGNHDFIGLDGTIPIIKEMKVQMLGFPSMADEEFSNISASITHGRVVNIWTPNLVGANYAAFSNCSGGAVLHQNKLIGIHLESMWDEDTDMKGKPGMKERMKHVENNVAKKAYFSNFVNAAAIANFLHDRGIIKMPYFGSSSFPHGGRTTMVTSSGRRRK